MGFSIGLLPKDGKKPMHYNSVRFGWRYNPSTDKIEVAPYWYVKGVRHYAETDSLSVCQLDIDKLYSFSINSFEDWYFLAVKTLAGEVIEHWSIDMMLLDSWLNNKIPRYGWSATLWFGGNAPAPHRVQVMKGNLPQ
jgi:hypothetical protein